MEEIVTQRLMDAALKTDDIEGWLMTVRHTGLRVTYTWQHENKNYYTVEAFVPWETIKRAPKNPLLVVLDDLAKQFMEWTP